MSLKPAGELAQELILLFFLAIRKAKYYPSEIVLTNSSWELRTLRKKVMLTIFSPSHQPKFH